MQLGRSCVRQNRGMSRFTRSKTTIIFAAPALTFLIGTAIGAYYSVCIGQTCRVEFSVVDAVGNWFAGFAAISAVGLAIWEIRHEINRRLAVEERDAVRAAKRFALRTGPKGSHFNYDRVRLEIKNTTRSMMENIVVLNARTSDILAEEGFLDDGRQRTFVVKLEEFEIPNLAMEEREARTHIRDLVRPRVEIQFTIEGWRFSNVTSDSGVASTTLIGRDFEPTFQLSEE